MIEWIILIFFTAIGGALLVRPAWFGPLDGRRGSTLLGFLLLTLGMTSPIILYPSQMMLDSGAGSDAFIGTWNLWWTRTALEQGQNPFFTDSLFAPHGTSLALHTHSVTYGILSLPAQWILGPDRLFLVNNLILLFSFTFTGYFTYRLALAQTQHRGGALLAGVIFAFINFRFANTVRLHVLATEWLVLFVWSWIALLARPTPWRLLLWMGSGILLLHASLEYTAYAVLLLVLLGIAEWLKQRSSSENAKGLSELSSGGRPSLRSWFGLGVPGFLVSLALLWPFLSQFVARQREGNTEFDPRSVAHFSADLLDFFLLNPRHPLWRSTFESITAGFHRGDGGFGLSLGWVVLGLFVWAGLVLLRARRGRRWVLGFLFFCILSLGPVLHIGGKQIGVFPMPQAILVEGLPFLASSRTPIRYLAPAALCLSIAIALAWAERYRGRISEGKSGHMSGSGIFLGVLILFESLSAPMVLTPVQVPNVYRFLRAQEANLQRDESGDRSRIRKALLHLPPVSARDNLLFQTVHELSLVENVESAVPLRSHSATTLVKGSTIRTLYALGQQGVFAGMTKARRDETLREIESFLSENGIRWIVIRPTHQRGSSAYQAYQENLRFLSHSEEREVDGYTVFRF